MAEVNKKAKMGEIQSFIDEVNVEYEKVHVQFEEQFWGTKMALASEKYSTDELLRTKQSMEEFLASEAKLKATRELLQSGGDGGEEPLTPEQEATLKLFERTFGCYIMESEEARRLRGEATALEGTLEKNRNDLVLGTVDPDNGAFLDPFHEVIMLIPRKFLTEHFQVKKLVEKKVIAKILHRQDKYIYMQI